jgi:DNA-binding NtrC family response regulator
MKQILIIDDEHRIGRSYTVLLSEEGFEVRYASGTVDATNLLLSENFDLILLDINMPEGGGKKIYEIIREYNPNMKVIVSSVYPIEEQIQIILGASGYHDKSQGVDILVEKVREVLQGVED